MEKENNVIFYRSCKVIPEEGLVFSRFGFELGRGKKRFQYIDEEGRKHQSGKLKFVYEATIGRPLTRGEVITPKDGDWYNSRLDNACVTTRKEHFKDYDYTVCARADQELIDAVKYDRKRGLSYQQLYEKYDMSVSTIQKIVKGIYYNDSKKDETDC